MTGRYTLTISGEYCGPIDAMVGETAILKRINEQMVQAQFDNLQMPDPFNELCYNWHIFPNTDFQITTKVIWW